MFIRPVWRVRAQPEPFWYWIRAISRSSAERTPSPDLRFSRLRVSQRGYLGSRWHIYFLIGILPNSSVVCWLQWGLDFLQNVMRVRVLSVEPPSGRTSSIQQPDIR